MNVKKLKRYHVYGEDDYHGTIIDEDSEGEFVKYSDLINEVMKDCYNQEENTCSIKLTKEQARLLFDISKNEVSEEWSVSKLLKQALEEVFKEPSIGDRCAFWNEDRSDYAIGYLESIGNSSEKYNMASRKDDVKYNTPCDCFKNCEKIKKDAEF